MEKKAPGDILISSSPHRADKQTLSSAFFSGFKIGADNRERGTFARSCTAALSRFTGRGYSVLENLPDRFTNPEGGSFFVVVLNRCLLPNP